MEDAATAEISRCQLWQWIRHRVSTTDTHTPITKELFTQLLKEHIENLKKKLGEQYYKRKYNVAAQLYQQ